MVRETAPKDRVPGLGKPQGEPGAWLFTAKVTLGA